jgi:hypothetical protein
MPAVTGLTPPRALHLLTRRDQSRRVSRSVALRTPVFSTNSTRLPASANASEASCGFCRLNDQSIEDRQMTDAPRSIKGSGAPGSRRQSP